MNARHEWLSDAVVLVAIGAAGTVVGTLWLWGGLAGALFGAGWPHVGVSELLGVLVRLPGRLTDPARAWPAVDR